MLIHPACARSNENHLRRSLYTRAALSRPSGAGIFPWPVSRECYRRSLAVSSTISVYVGILGVCLGFKHHWIFQIYIKVTDTWLLVQVLAQLPVSVARCITRKSLESHISGSEVYRTPQWRPVIIMWPPSGSSVHNDISVRFRAFQYLSYQREQASFAHKQLSSAVWLASLETQRTKHSKYLAI